MEEFLSFNATRPWIGLYGTRYRRASLIDLYLHTKFHSNRTNFLWMDGQAYVWTDIETGFIRSAWRSQPKKGSISLDPLPYCALIFQTWNAFSMEAPNTENITPFFGGGNQQWLLTNHSSAFRKCWPTFSSKIGHVLLRTPYNKIGQ